MTSFPNRIAQNFCVVSFASKKSLPFSRDKMLSSHQDCSAADFAMFQTCMMDTHVFNVTTVFCCIVTAKCWGLCLSVSAYVGNGKARIRQASEGSFTELEEAPSFLHVLFRTIMRRWLLVTEDDFCILRAGQQFSHPLHTPAHDVADHWRLVIFFLISSVLVLILPLTPTFKALNLLQMKKQNYVSFLLKLLADWINLSLGILILCSSSCYANLNVQLPELI